MATLIRPPLLTRIARTVSTAAVEAQAGVSSGALCLLFVAVGPAPFTQTDWPNPRSAGRASLAQTQGPTLALLTPPVAAPFALSEWPNPRGPVFPIENRTYLDASEFWMLQDTFYGLAGQPPTYAPAVNPIGRAFPSDLRTWTQSHLLDTLGIIVGSPFAQTDWPNPRGYPYPVSLRTFTDPLKVLAGQDVFFGVAGQPPTRAPDVNPRGRAFPSDLRTWTQDLVTGTLGLPVSVVISNDLTATLVAGSRYAFKAKLYVTADATGGHKYAMGGTATATAIVYDITAYALGTTTPILASRKVVLGGAAGESASGATNVYTSIEGTILANAAGTLTVQFAQNVGSGTSTLLAGSLFYVTKVG